MEKIRRSDTDTTMSISLEVPQPNNDSLFMIKTPILLLFTILIASFQETAKAQTETCLVLYPKGNGIETIGGGETQYHRFEWDKNGDAVTFDTYRAKDSVSWRTALSSTEPDGFPINPLPVSLPLLKIWDADSLRIKPGAKNKRFVSELKRIVGKELRKEKETPIHPYTGLAGSSFYDGLYRFSYRKQPCTILWDQADRCSKSIYRMVEYGGDPIWANRQEPHIPSSQFLEYAFEYSFRDVRQIALCRNPHKGYVILLLTQPIQSIDR